MNGPEMASHFHYVQSPGIYKLVYVRMFPFTLSGLPTVTCTSDVIINAAWVRKQISGVERRSTDPVCGGRGKEF